MHLSVHSAYSTRYGTIPVDQLVPMAAHRGLKALPLTDINNVSGIYEFADKARKAGIKPVAGMECREDNRLKYVALAKNDAGFGEMNRFVSRQIAEGARAMPHQAVAALDKTKQAMLDHERMVQRGDWEGLEEPQGVGPGTALPSNLRQLRYPDKAPDLEHVFFIYPFPGHPEAESLSDNEYIGIQPSELRRLHTSPLRHHPHKLVCLAPVTVRDEQDHALHACLRAIDRNVLLSQVQQGDTASPHARMMDETALRELYADHPYMLDNAEKILAACAFTIEMKTAKNKESFTGSKEEDVALLRELAYRGMAERYGGTRAEVVTRLEMELEIISRTGFCAYFLFAYDFVKFANSQGHQHAGRGSGANSLVAYCLYIMHVDVIKHNLPFERFLHMNRKTPPDFDVDFGPLTRYLVLTYLFNTHGTEHVAFVATYVTFHPRSALRELGKVYGLPKAEIDLLASMDPAQGSADPVVAGVLEKAARLVGLPNYLGIHSGGVVISEKPIYQYSATFVPPLGFPTLQFDMYVAEEIGLFKFDILSTRGLSHQQMMADLVEANYGVKVDIAHPSTFSLDEGMRRIFIDGTTDGIFYIESPASQDTCRSAHADRFEDLVMVTSIIRPGVLRSKSELMRRLRMAKGISPMEGDPEDWYTHPSLKPHLEITCGINVYQDQALTTAHVFAGLDFGEAEELRKAMTGKYKFLDLSEMRRKFFEGARERGHSEALTAETWNMLDSFAGISFCQSHSIAYILIAVVDAYFKVHYPTEFCLGVINNFGGYYSTEYYVDMARRLGTQVHGLCVNASAYLATGRDRWLRLGFVLLRSLEKGIADLIVERRRAGPYKDLRDLLRRVPELGIEQANILIKVGALAFTGKSKVTLYWELGPTFKETRKAEQPTLFEVERPVYAVPAVPDDPLVDAYDEIEVLGFPLCSPFDLVAEPPDPREVLSRQLLGMDGKTVILKGYYVTTKHAATKHGESMSFVTFKDVEGSQFTITMFPQLHRSGLIHGQGVYKIMAAVRVQLGVAELTAQRVRPLPYKPDPRHVGAGHPGEVG